MRTILLFDHFVALGGAEKVSLHIARALPDCSLETAWADSELFGAELKSGELKHYGLAFSHHWFPTLALCWFYLFRYSLTSRKVNLIVSGVFSPLVLFRRRQLANTLVYFHTFPSFVNLSVAELRAKHGWLGAAVFRCFAPVYCYLLRKSVQKGKSVFANSRSVQTRFKAIGIDTEVLYPPVDLVGLQHHSDMGYFLSAARLEPNKRVELLLEAFTGLEDIQLHLVGGGSLEKSLKARFGHYANINFFGWMASVQLKTQYNQCKALIYIPENEYFGLAPIEAMAAGKPVLGVSEGGLLETISDARLGILLSTPLALATLRQGIRQLHKETLSETDIRYRQQQATRFSVPQFIEQLNRYLL
jgi:glycosyltransferase involved in cell wall biosynthesis